jgi:hypothetical protein
MAPRERPKAFVARVDAEGQCVWAATVEPEKAGQAVVVDDVSIFDEDPVYIAGHAYNEDGSASEPPTAFIERIGPRGSTVFRRSFPEPPRFPEPFPQRYPLSRGGHVSAATKIGVVHTISSGPDGTGRGDLEIESLGEDGRTLWRTPWDRGFRPLVAAGPDGSIYAAGFAMDPRKLTPRVHAAFEGYEPGEMAFVKFDAAGRPLWTSALRERADTGHAGHVVVVDMAVGEGDRLWVLGFFKGELPLRGDLLLPGLRDGDLLLHTLFLARFSSSGEVEWGEVVGQAPTDDVDVVSQELAATREGDIVASLFYGDPKDWGAVPPATRASGKYFNADAGASARCSVRRYHAP